MPDRKPSKSSKSSPAVSNLGAAAPVDAAAPIVAPAPAPADLLSSAMPSSTSSIADLKAESGADGALTLRIAGRLDAEGAAALWRKALALVEEMKPARLILRAEAVDYCDGAGAGLLVEMRERQLARGAQFALEGMPAQYQRLFDLFPPDPPPPPPAKPQPAHLPEEAGRAAMRLWSDFRELIHFVGELCAALLLAARRPGRVRWKDALLSAERAGVNAMPIIALIGFLLGLIMAFQSAIPMRRFGADIFVANLVALSLLRELGPLITAVVLAGRSGSAFAAEIGTMKVNEEINALTTMGLDPVRFLAVPRVIAAVAMTPLLTLFANLMGLVGGAVVLLSLGFPLVTYINQVLSAVHLNDFLSGMTKAFVFGILVSGIGCLRGLQTKIGASAVGESTTSAVVSGIVLIAVTDGVFAVVFYFLGI